MPLFFLLNAPMSVQPDSAPMEDWDALDLDFSEDDGDDLDSISAYRSTCTPSNALGVIAALPGAADTIRKDVFLRTNQLQTRYIGDLPLFIRFNTGHSFFSIIPFFNYTEKMNFYKGQDLIRCYLDFEDNIVVEALKSFPHIDGRKGLGLLSQFKMREIKTGLMFQGRKHWTPRIYTGFQLPWYFYIRHHNLTDQERLELEHFLRLVIGDCDDTPELEVEKVVAGDALGFGDLRFNAAWKWCEQDTFSFTVGGRITLPTAGAFKRGLVGSDFSDVRTRPYLDLDEAVCNLLDSVGPPAQPEKKALAEEQVATWATSTANWLNGNLLVPPLGQERHLSIGLFVEPHFHVNNQVSVYTRASVDYIFGRHSTRYMLGKRDLENFSSDYLGETVENDEARRRLDFLSEMLQDKVAPFKTCVSLGARKQYELLFMPTFRIADNLIFQFGYDFWWLEKECITGIDQRPIQKYLINRIDDTSFETIYSPKEIPLETEKAERSASYQSKFFGSLDYRKFYKDSDITFSLGGDITLGSKGVGEDFTVKLGISWRY